MSKPEPIVDSITLGELNCWRFSHGNAVLVVAQQGAHVVSFQVDGEEPLIWSNPQAVFNQGKAIRGGIPVCWPWFGNLDRNPQSVQAMRTGQEPAKAHGEVRAIDWELSNVAEDGDALVIEFIQLQAENGQLPGWPHKVALKSSIRLENGSLDVSLLSYNNGEQPVTFSQALHSYFNVGDIHTVSVEGLDGLKYLDTLHSWDQEQTQSGPLTFAGETDRIYLNTPNQLSIVDPSLGRRIQVHTRGSNSSVLWNPWIEKTRRFSDMAADGWQGMVCVETANVLGDVVTLEPKALHVMGVTVYAEPL